MDAVRLTVARLQAAKLPEAEAQRRYAALLAQGRPPGGLGRDDADLLQALAERLGKALTWTHVDLTIGAEIAPGRKE